MLYLHTLDLPTSLLWQGASIQSQLTQHTGTSPKLHVHGVVDQNWLEIGKHQNRSPHVVVVLQLCFRSPWIWYWLLKVQQGEQS